MNKFQALVKALRVYDRAKERRDHARINTSYSIIVDILKGSEFDLDFDQSFYTTRIWLSRYPLSIIVTAEDFDDPDEMLVDSFYNSSIFPDKQ